MFSSTEYHSDKLLNFIINYYLASKDFNGGAVKLLKNASCKRDFLFKKQRIMGFDYRGI